MLGRGDSEVTWEALREYGSWRVELEVDTILQGDRAARLATHPLSRELFWLGPTRDGIPTLCLLAKEHVVGDIPMEEHEQYWVYLMEYAREKWGVGEGVGLELLIDRVGQTLANNDVGLVRFATPRAQAHYPEIVERVVVTPINFVFFIVWRVARLLLRERVRRRFVLVADGGQKRTDLLEKTWDTALLPESLGGSLPKADYPPMHAHRLADGKVEAAMKAASLG